MAKKALRLLFLSAVLFVVPVFITGCMVENSYYGPGELDSKELYGQPKNKYEFIPYKLYPGETRPLEQIAVVNLGSRFVAIDGLLVDSYDYRQIHLLPGHHEIFWIHRKIDLQLMAGHSYKLDVEQSYDQKQKQVIFVYRVVDVLTEETLTEWTKLQSY